MKHQYISLITGLAGGVALALIIITTSETLRGLSPFSGSVSETWWEEQATIDSGEPVEADDDILGIAKAHMSWTRGDDCGDSAGQDHDGHSGG